jgi:hypothetical protein
MLVWGGTIYIEEACTKVFNVSVRYWPFQVTKKKFSTVSQENVFGVNIVCKFLFANLQTFQFFLKVRYLRLYKM